MSKAISSVKLTDTLTLAERKDGYWLYDYTRGMNVSLRAKTEREAFVQAITYYQKRCAQVENEHKKLHTAVSAFVNSLSDDDY